jgi:hypothetical protein
MEDGRCILVSYRDEEFVPGVVGSVESSAWKTPRLSEKLLES